MRLVDKQHLLRTASVNSIRQQLNAPRFTKLYPVTRFNSWSRVAAVKSGYNTAMSDEEYQKFLDKATEQTNTSLSHQTGFSSHDAERNLVQEKPLPKTLQSLIDQQRVYSTDSDEPFRAINVAFTGPTTHVSEALFTELFDKHGSKMGMKDFDAHGEYFDVIECVAEAAGREAGEVEIFKTQSGRVRSEYWIITIAHDKRHVIGVVATAIES